MKKLIVLLLALCLLTGCVAHLDPNVPGLSDEPNEPAIDTPNTPDTPDNTPATPDETPNEPAVFDEEAYLDTLLDAMTLEELVGQMFFVRCPESGAAEDVAAYHLGGLLLFGRDYKNAAGEWLSADTLTRTLQSYQDAANIPLFIGSDEEGGTVTRATRNPNLFSEKLASPQQLYAAGGMERVASETLSLAQRLRELGINVDFAPVCDVSTDENDFIYARSFGRSAEETCGFVTTAVNALHSGGTAAVLKHFPGYGNNVDTHTGIAIDTRDYQSFVENDFLPFSAGIAAGADFVLVSHNIVECMDASLPASLSVEVHRVLREELGFDGVIITDDLAMDAVDAYAGGEAAVLAVLAGNDMLCTGDYQTDIPAVLNAVRSGRIDEAQIRASVRRILRAKLSLGLITLPED